jgi:hypothetical protein
MNLGILEYWSTFAELDSTFHNSRSLSHPVSRRACETSVFRSGRVPKWVEFALFDSCGQSYTIGGGKGARLDAGCPMLDDGSWINDAGWCVGFCSSRAWCGRTIGAGARGILRFVGEDFGPIFATRWLWSSCEKFLGAELDFHEQFALLLSRRPTRKCWAASELAPTASNRRPVHSVRQVPVLHGLF